MSVTGLLTRVRAYQLLPPPVKCRQAAFFTRDALTAADLNQQGLKKAQFVGSPVMENLSATGKDLQLMPGVRTLDDCLKNGLERMGRSGGSMNIANYLAKYLN